MSEIFRFLRLEEHVAPILRGSVWITTLESCRQQEGERRDENEGRLIHNIGHFTVDSSDPASIEAYQQTGIFTAQPGITDVSFSNVTFDGGISNAYILCLTEHYRPDFMEAGFGRFCIRVRNPMQVFLRITRRMAMIHEVRDAIIGRVRYEGREVTDYETRNVPPPLLKPIDGYTHQQEIRMVWIVGRQSYPLKPFPLECPEAATYFQEVPTAYSSTPPFMRRP